MAAKPKPDHDPKARAELFVAGFQQNYSDAIAEARLAAETTQTDAWSRNYREQVKTHRTFVVNALADISSTAENIRSYDTNEEAEKGIRDAVKSLAEERIRHQAWKTRTVAPYSNTVERCEQLLKTVMQSAEDEERNAPLVDRGLASEVRAIVNKWPVAKWDDENGVASVIDQAA